MFLIDKSDSSLHHYSSFWEQFDFCKVIRLSLLKVACLLSNFQKFHWLWDKHQHSIKCSFSPVESNTALGSTCYSILALAPIRIRNFVLLRQNNFLIGFSSTVGSSLSIWRNHAPSIHQWFLCSPHSRGRLTARGDDVLARHCLYCVCQTLTSIRRRKNLLLYDRFCTSSHYSYKWVGLWRTQLVIMKDLSPCLLSLFLLLLQRAASVTILEKMAQDSDLSEVSEWSGSGRWSSQPCYRSCRSFIK